ncbi:MAG: FAD-dependent oxidoreductase, partial [Deltaproteobacteria bacterium]|nr:FAD-dependent oxidoreductase [Deltaproteobacteria bacterium]
GVKAAEYRLTANPDGVLPVYTFCMCPGGIVVPAAAYEKTNIVNGMSLYQRDLKFANAACVAAVNPYEIIGENADAGKVLDWVESLECAFYDYSGGYQAPFCSISDFIKKKHPQSIPETSFPLGLKSSALWELLPGKVSVSMRAGLMEFCKKIKGFETGIIMGLESKTSAPIQVLRDEGRNCSGIENLYISGEGSGFAGGIISSAADGVKTGIAISIQKG